MIARLFLAALLALGSATMGTVRTSNTLCRIRAPYHGIAAVRLSTSTAEQDIWEDLRRLCEVRQLENGVVLLTRSQLELLQRTTPSVSATSGVKYEVIEQDLGARIARERRTACGAFDSSATFLNVVQGYVDGGTSGKSPAVLNPMFHDKFRPYSSLVARWDAIVRAFQNTRLERIGRSVEKRALYAIRIGRATARRRILVLFGQHAREWASVAAGTYVSEQLAQRGVPLDVEVIVVPLVNPDGYEYSRVHDRLWRKNRGRASLCNMTLTLSGVDLNRNWGKDFGGFQTTSRDECSDIYHGTAAFSEPETAAVRALGMKLKGLVGMLDVHSFSQLVIGPWAYTNAIPPHVQLVDKLGKKIANAAGSNGEMYLYGRGDENLMYLASGVAPDWFFDRGVKAAYTLELRPGRFQPLGFELPPALIVPTAMDAFDATNVLVQFAVDENNAEKRRKRRYKAVSSDGTSSIPLIVGVSLGAFMVLLLVIAIYVIVRRRKKNNTNTDVGSSDSSSSSGSST